MDVYYRKIQERWLYVVNAYEEKKMMSSPSFISKAKQHLAQNEEGYIAHFLFAAKHTLILIYAGLALLIHAIFPCLHMTTASNIVRKLYYRFSKRNAVVAPNKHATRLHPSEQYYI